MAQPLVSIIKYHVLVTLLETFFNVNRKLWRNHRSKPYIWSNHSKTGFVLCVVSSVLISLIRPSPTAWLLMGCSNSTQGALEWSIESSNGPSASDTPRAAKHECIEECVNVGVYVQQQVPQPVTSEWTNSCDAKQSTVASAICIFDTETSTSDTHTSTPITLSRYDT